MNLIRLIKLKKLNGELDNLSDQEKMFLSTWDNLVCDGNVYMNKNTTCFIYNSAEKKFYYTPYFKLETSNIMFRKNFNKFIKQFFLERLGIDINSANAVLLSY